MRTLAAVTVLAALAVTPLGAQEGERHIQSGDWSLSFSLQLDYLTTSSGSFALWRMMSGRLNLGLGVSLGGSVSTGELVQDTLSLTQSANGWSLRLEPAVKWYMRPPRTVAPYLYVGAGPQFSWSEQSSSAGEAVADRHAYGVGVATGLGVDWLPVHWFSLGARTGFRLDFTHTRDEYGVALAQVAVQDRVAVQSFTSNVFVQVYF
jgi:hypothetical protein